MWVFKNKITNDNSFITTKYIQEGSRAIEHTNNIFNDDIGNALNNLTFMQKTSLLVIETFCDKVIPMIDSMQDVIIVLRDLFDYQSVVDRRSL